jgi:peptide/nickel transport system substrate-binding protein
MNHRNIPILFILFLLLAGCSGAAPDGNEGAEDNEPVVLRVGRAGSPDTLNPGAAQITYAFETNDLVYDSMYQFNTDGTYSLELAEGVEVSNDGLIWTFKIRAGFTFHDGEPLTADDIPFSYNFYQSTPEFPFLPGYTQFFESVEAPDESTVIITLSEALPNLESQLIYLFVLPEHIWGSLEQAPAEFENLEMVGSGPFQLVEYSQDEFIHLASTHEHPLYSPHIDEIIIQKFDNHDALAQALRTGQVDMITEMPNTAVPSLKDEANIEVASGPFFNPSVDTIFFNLMDDENCPEDGGICTGHPALRDRQVRLALAHATDKQKLLDVVLLGLGDPGLTLVPSGMQPFFNDSLEDYVFDIELANTILDDAGYLDSDGDEVREMPDGSQSLSIRLNYQDDIPNSPRLSELLKEMWAEIGVSAEIQGLEFDALLATCCPTFDYDVILWGWAGDPDPGFLLSILTTDSIPIGNNETGYSNPIYDGLFDQQQSELDKATRLDLVWEMQRIALEDIAYIIPYYSHAVQAYRTDQFTGWPVAEDGRQAFEHITSLIAVEPVR